jgi:DNA-binding protein H-NS
MSLDSLEKLADEELRVVIARAEELLAQHDRERKAEALNKARVLLESVGLSLKDVAAGKAKPVKAPGYKGGHLYQHPANKALVWNAKGQKPNWLRELEGEGGKAIEIESASDNAPVPLKKTG